MNVRNLLAICLLTFSTHAMLQSGLRPMPGIPMNPSRQLNSMLSAAGNLAKGLKKKEAPPSTDTFIEGSSEKLNMDNTDETLKIINMNIRSEIMGKIQDMIGGLDQRLKDMQTNFNQRIQRIHSGINNKVDGLVKTIKEKAQQLQNSNKI